MFFVADFYFGQISVVLEIFRESKKEKFKRVRKKYACGAS